MSLIIRRIIFYLATAIFLITAPLIIGYTAGYRYHFKQHRIVKTGGLFITTGPKDAIIEINSSIRTETTPASILNLTPGEYRVRLVKDGYYPWEKKLSVESERLTFAQNIVLMRATSPRQLSAGDITDAALMSRDETIIYRVGDLALNEVWAKRGTAKETLLWRGSGGVRTLTPSNRSNEIFVMDGKDYAPLVISGDKNNTPLDLGLLVNPPLTHPRVDVNDSNIIYAISKGTLMYLNTKTHVVRPILPGVRDFLPTKDGFLILSEKPIPELLRYDGTTKTRITTLEANAAELFEQINTLVPVWNTARGETMFIDLKKPDLANAIRIPGKVVASMIMSDELSIIAANDHEIWRVSLRSGHPELITRIGDLILATYLHPEGNVLVYATPERIRALELDARDGRIIYDLATFEQIDAARLSRDGSYLLIAGTREKNRGLWRLDIR